MRKLILFIVIMLAAAAGAAAGGIFMVLLYHHVSPWLAFFPGILIPMFSGLGGMYLVYLFDTGGG